MTHSKKISELREALNVPYQDRKLLLGSAIEDAAKSHLTLLEAIEAGTWKIVPVEPTEEQWGGLARDIAMWARMEDHTGSALYTHLEMLGREIPDWLKEEVDNTPFVPPKGTVAAIIYKAMIENSHDYPREG